MLCSRCHFGEKPEVPSSHLTALLGLSNPRDCWAEMERWAAQNVVAGFTHYCTRCRKVTWLLQLDYALTAPQQLASAYYMRRIYGQTNPRGHGVQAD